MQIVPLSLPAFQGRTGEGYNGRAADGGGAQGDEGAQGDPGRHGRKDKKAGRTINR